MQVRDVMTHGVIGVPEDTSVAEAIETMLRSRVSALFVFDAKHELDRDFERGRPPSPQRARKRSTSAPAGSNSCSAAGGSPRLTRMSTGGRSGK